jgi:hypothetical protein
MLAEARMSDGVLHAPDVSCYDCGKQQMRMGALKTPENLWVTYCRSCMFKHTVLST